MMTIKLKYESPDIQMIELGIDNSILTGSIEGGGGNENYAPFPNPFNNYGDSNDTSSLF